MALYRIVCMLIPLLILLQTEHNLAIHIEISPEIYNRFTHDAVHVSCTLDEADTNAKKIVMFELCKDDEPIVVLHPYEQPLIADPNEKGLKAVGHIDTIAHQSSLNVTIVNPQSNDFGVYTCVMYFKAGIDNFKEQRASVNFTEEKLDMNAIKDILNYMKNKISTIEEKVKYTSAFSATNKKDIPTTRGKITILPDVVMRMGNGYDETTGIFTAPRNGVYVFHLVVTDDKRGCGLDMDLMANNKVLARLFTIDRIYAQQSSISSVVNLKAGDKVFSIMKDSHCGLEDRLYTMFTGYLINAL